LFKQYDPAFFLPSDLVKDMPANIQSFTLVDSNASITRGEHHNVNGPDAGTMLLMWSRNELTK
jgi:hypothetical protein